jgi:hypothetical protein
VPIRGHPFTANVMNLPLHLFRLLAAPTGADRETTLRQITRNETEGNKPLFKAPALPTPLQLNNELPFTVNLRPRLRERT